MNVLLAVVLVGLARVGLMTHAPEMTSVCNSMALLSLFLCFFNLLPIPPLDGSHVFRSLMGISYDAYYAFARWGFLILIVVMQIPWVQYLLSFLTFASWATLTRVFGMS
jgi:Zn-dependent protease